MTQQSGRYGSKANERNGMADQVGDRTKELAEEALDRADEWLKPTGLSIKERPMTVLAVVGGLAFAAGAAFWMLKRSRQQSRYEELAATLSDLPRRAGWR
jgi:type VI protein secretion system component VasF